MLYCRQALRAVGHTPVQRHRNLWSRILYGEDGEGTQSREVQEIGGYGLTTPKEAQKMSATRIPNFLSDTEIKRLLETSLEIRRAGAGPETALASLKSHFVFAPTKDRFGYNLSLVRKMIIMEPTEANGTRLVVALSG